jgi:TPR repeat protein
LNGFKKVCVVANFQNINTFNTFLLPAAKAGHPEAQFNLAVMYGIGEGVDKDMDKEFEWCQKGVLSRILQNINTLSALLLLAAEAGVPKAQFNLGCLYQFGKGVEANSVKAAEWYQKGMSSRILQNISQPPKQEFLKLN